MGRTFNVSNNPVAENAIKKLHKERLKLDPAGGLLYETQLAIITRNINLRIRLIEIIFRRDQITNQVKYSLDDDQLADNQFNTRVAKHNKIILSLGPTFSVGDNVIEMIEQGAVKCKGSWISIITITNLGLNFRRQNLNSGLKSIM